MKKKEILIIFLLAVLVTLIVGMLTEGLPFSFLFFEKVCLAVIYPDGRQPPCSPLRVDFELVPFILDFLFWFLVLAALYHVGYRVKWWVVKWLRRKRK